MSTWTKFLEVANVPHEVFRSYLYVVIMMMEELISETSPLRWFYKSMRILWYLTGLIDLVVTWPKNKYMSTPIYSRLTTFIEAFDWSYAVVRVIRVNSALIKMAVGL